MGYGILVIAIIGVLFSAGCQETSILGKAATDYLIHDVYFALNDGSTAAREKLVKDCHKYLKGHEGIVFFAAGEVVESHRRDVNDRDWDVSLHIVFESKEKHDQYQEAADHYKFIEENKDNWKNVRVFDSYIKGTG